MCRSYRFVSENLRSVHLPAVSNVLAKTEKRVRKKFRSFEIAYRRGFREISNRNRVLSYSETICDGRNHELLVKDKVIAQILEGQCLQYCSGVRAESAHVLSKVYFQYNIFDQTNNPIEEVLDPWHSTRERLLPRPNATTKHDVKPFVSNWPNQSFCQRAVVLIIGMNHDDYVGVSL